MILRPSFHLATGVGLEVYWHFGSGLFSIYNDNFTRSFTSWNFSVFHTQVETHFDLNVKLTNDRAFSDPFMDSYYAGYYFDFAKALVTLRFGNVTVTIGKGNPSDVVESPYSLFLTSAPVLRNTLAISYEDERFIYVTRWIELSNLKSGSSELAKKRGANFKLYGTKVGNVRFGYQEANVYAGRTFDFEFFANPTPGFFVQYLNEAGRPFPEGFGEANYLLGFFLDFRNEKVYAYAQVLIDDINMNRILKPAEFQNPDKLAWSVGGKLETDIGSFAVFHAGATKYTFQPTAEGASLPQNFYGYTVFTDFRYLQQDGLSMVLPLELLYLGYKYGENNAAIAFVFEPPQHSPLLMGSKLWLEYVVLGERSPVNPWGEFVGPPSGTHWLGEPVLERRFVLGAELMTKLVEWKWEKITAEVDAKILFELGYLWNRSEPIEVGGDNSGKPLLRPVEGRNMLLASLGTGLRFRLSW